MEVLDPNWILLLFSAINGEIHKGNGTPVLNGQLCELLNLHQITFSVAFFEPVITSL